MLSKLLNAIPGDFIGKLLIYAASAGARNRTLLDKVLRFVVGTFFAVPKNDDFMADPLIDNDQGFDVEELRKYRNSGNQD